MCPVDIIERKELRDRWGVFRDRAHAGDVLADMLHRYRHTDAIVLAIPAGGVPVAAVVADKLGVPLEVTVVSKITLPWNSEAGYGAVAFDGTVRLNEDLLPHLGLAKREIQHGIDQTLQKVLRRVRMFRGNRPFPALAERPAILIDDGLASGFTLLVAVEALRNSSAQHIIVAVPTGHEKSLFRTAGEVEAIYCANIRTGLSFAVADAYERWSDVDEDEVVRIYQTFIEHQSHMKDQED